MKTLVNFFPDLFQAEVEETLKRIQSHKGVIGTMVVRTSYKPSNKQQISLTNKITKKLTTNNSESL